MNSEYQITDKTQHKNPEHVHLKFLTPPTEKTVTLHGLSKFINQEI